MRARIGPRCARAREVARAYDRSGVAPRPWFCGLAHGPGDQRVVYSCGYGGTGDLRKMPHSIVVKVAPPGELPWPVTRPAASAEAQAFMPLLYLDDDEHWPLSNPDWFLGHAGVRHCRRPRAGCAPISKATLQDPSRRYLNFEPERLREGPPVTSVEVV